jgi:glycosyltransferase involved in cell wall biosynthesis
MHEFPVTVHTIVKNEDRFISYALKSVLPFVQKLIIFDTGSTDNTWEIIQKLQSLYPQKITSSRKRIKSAHDISLLRQEQINLTKTPWFLLLDGDEIWSSDQISKLLSLTQTLPKNVMAVVNKTKNCVGDIYHYLPQKFGKYSFFSKTGHFNIRLMRTYPYHIKDTYPNETYYYQNSPINSQYYHLHQSDAWYLHCSHLNRSSSPEKTFGRRKTIFTKGQKLNLKQVPEILLKEGSIDILKHRSSLFELTAGFVDLLRSFI